MVLNSKQKETLMDKQAEKIRDELQRYRCEHGLAKKEDCSLEENSKLKKMIKDGSSLPNEVVQYVGSAGEPVGLFYRMHKADLTEKEIGEYIAFKQLDTLNTIKSCLMFFVVMSLVSVVAGVIFGLSVL